MSATTAGGGGHGRSRSSGSLDPGSPAGLTEPRILVVDDSRFDRERTAEALVGLGTVVACADGAEAIRVLEQGPADVIVSDLTMPGMTGLQLLERVRREHAGTDLVLLTGYASVESAVQALRMGAADYLTKPAPEEGLRRAVEQLLLRRRLLEENRQLRDALRTVDACRALSPFLDPGEVYPVVLDLVLSATGRRRGLAVFRRSQGAMSDGTAFRGFSEGEEAHLHAWLVEGKPLDLAAHEGTRVLDAGRLHEALARVGSGAAPVLAVGIGGEQSEAGVVAVASDGRGFATQELERARIVATHGHAALVNAERYNDAKERAFVDDVTELYNARFLLSAAENEIRRAERYGNELSVLFLDLDRFKRVNDRFGHLVGSQTLRHLAQMLQHSVRQVDTLARYGGDEFTILLVDTPHAEALQIAERIRRSVGDHVFEAGREARLHLTVSIGVATLPRHGRGRDALLDAADKAMYLAKSRGRDRVCSADDLLESVGERVGERVD